MLYIKSYIKGLYLKHAKFLSKLNNYIKIKALL